MSGSSRAAKSPGTKNTADGAAQQPRKAALSTPLIRAAGGAVWRRVPAGVEVVLVHRPAYDDWALPKGKLEPGETDEEAALREVREETGLSCRLGTELPSTTYADGQGRPKVVRYWTMTVVPGTGAPGTGAAAGVIAANGASEAAGVGATSVPGEPAQGVGSAGRVTANRVTGDRVTGSRVTGDRVAGDRVAGDRVVGDRVTDNRLMPEPKARQEIDEACWAPLGEARGRLTYPRDVVVLDALADFLSQSDVRR